jgi:predicted Zn-dependent peptidase
MKICETVLSNGLRVLVSKNESSYAFDLAYHIDSGSRDETISTNGVSHLLEHMLFRGTKRFPNSILLAQELESYGGECNAMTTQENTVYWLRGSNLKLRSALTNFSEFLSTPNFADFETEKKIVLQELENDYNENQELIDPESLSAKAFFGEHGLGLPIVGTRDSIAGLNEEHLLCKLREFYHPRNATLTISTQVDPDLVLSWVSEIFQCFFDSPNLNSGMYSKPQKTLFQNRSAHKKIQLQENSDSQFNLKILFQSSGGINSEVVLETFLQRILDDGIASRFPASIREKKGLVYDISCDSNAFLEVGYTSIDATVSKDNLHPLLLELTSELLKALSIKPSTEEMERTKFRYLFDLQTCQEQSSRMLSREVYNGFFGQQFSVEQEMEVVKSITSEQVLATAQKVFLSPLKSFTLVGPKARKQRNYIESFWAALS